jgi:hypothetical protein
MRSKRFILLFLFLAGNILYAQQTEISVHLFASGSYPAENYIKKVDDYTAVTIRSGLKIGDKIGLAQPGFGVGGELNTPVWFDGLFWTFSGSFFINGTDGSKAQSAFRSQWQDTVAVNLDVGTWINIPILTGFRYDYYFARQMLVYGIAQIGINLSKAPYIKATVGDVVAEEVTYEFARDIAYQFGIGLVYNQTYNISLRYMNLGTPRYNGTKNLTEVYFPEIFSRTQHIIGEERSIAMYIVTLGIQLFP